MLNSVLKYALENREQIMGSLDRDSKHVLADAIKGWNEYEPESTQVPLTLGIDGSYNNSKYQGVDLWVASGIAARPDGSTHTSTGPEMGYARNSQPAEVMQRLEIEACEKSIDSVEIVLMDGSLHAGLGTMDAVMRNRLVRVVEKNKKKIVFMSKTSDANHEFKATAGDIYYYSKASNEMGFSDILVKESPHGGLQISSTYVRLAHSAPLVKIEILGKIGNDNIQDLMSNLFGQSVGGYPSALRQAHNLCTITNEDVEKITRIMGTKGLVGSRGALE